LVYGCDGYLIAKLAKCSGQHLRAFLLFSGTDCGALLDKSHSFMQDLPDQTTEPMSNGPDNHLHTFPTQEPLEHSLFPVHGTPLAFWTIQELFAVLQK
jgi:hypothetical protein